MNVSRRDVVVAGASAFGASGLLLSGAASAQGGDEAAVAQNVEILRKAQLEADRASLAQVTSDQVSYGHSDGRVDRKSTRLNSSHVSISYAVFCLKKKREVRKSAGGPQSY